MMNRTVSQSVGSSEVRGHGEPQQGNGSGSGNGTQMFTQQPFALKPKAQGRAWPDAKLCFLDYWH